MADRSRTYQQTAQINLTDASATELVALLAGYSIKVKDVIVGNEGGTTSVLSLRDGTSGKVISFPLTTESAGSLFPQGWKLTAGNNFQGFLDGVGDVKLTIFWTLEK